jgi:integrase
MAKKAKNRADGEGSVFKRGDKFIAQVTWLGPSGKRHTKMKVASKEGDARKALTKLQTSRDAGRLVVTGRTTAGEWLTAWLETYVKDNRAPKTYTGYHQTITNYVPDYIRRIPLGKIAEATEAFDSLFGHVKKENGGRTAENLRTVLRASFNVAKKKRRIETNPIVDTEPIRYDRAETGTFTLEEGLRFLDAAENDRLGCLFVVMLSLGLREGEGIGLKADDIELDACVLHVRRSLQWNKMPGEKEGRWIERPPKAKSKRDLPITETIRRAVIQHLARRQKEAGGKGWLQDSGYLFTSVSGAPLHARNVLEAFHQLCDAAQVPRIRVHDARHSCATLLHAQKADGFTIQQVLGHSQLSTTRRYTHVDIAVTKPAITALESAFDGERKKQEEKRQQERNRAAAAEAIQPPTTLVQ